MTTSNESRSRKAARWFFEDRRTGRIVVAQAPNLALWVFLGTLALSSYLKPADGFGTAVRVVQAVALTVWALDEIVRGVNPWRRVLGGAVLIVGTVLWLKR